jgi:tetratricopeptide (TPR) repeat protein
MSYNGRGLIRAFKEDFKGAAADYERAIELDPILTPAYINRGILRFQMGSLNGALTDLNKALELDPNSAKTFIERGSVRGIMGEIDEAIADIKKGFALNSESVSDNDPGYFSSPFKNLSRFIGSHPANARAYEIRGIFRLAQEKNIAAADDFRRSLALDPKLKSEIDKAMKVAF